MTFPRLAFLILPYTRLELPGWGQLFRLMRVGGIENNALWRDAPTRTIRDKRSKYLVRLDLSNWSERHTYFLGRYYDLALQMLLSEVLAPGDRFVDVGANIGAITLYGAALVGPGGRVDSFEPNPSCCERIRHTLAGNDVHHVRVHANALSDRRGTLVLNVFAEHTGTATLAPPSQEQRDLVKQQYEVQVLVGDEAVSNSRRRINLIKVDVEGFEVRVLRGLMESIRRWRPVVVTEVQRDWLARAGTSRTEMFDLMAADGYGAYGLSTRRRVLGHRLSLEPIQRTKVENAPFSDVVWLHPSTAASQNLRILIEAATGG
jgi:FkbM family methyltransferase